MPEVFRGRAVIHFVDNVIALSCLVHGYASKPDCARLVNLYHAQVVGLRCVTYGEWVPSKANPADIPTREDRKGEMPADTIDVGLAIPPIAEVERDPLEWIVRVRAGTTQGQ